MTTLSLPETTVTLSEAQAAIRVLADRYSLLLLSAPGVGKSDAIAQVAATCGMPLRSLLGTQIAPEDVSGVPRIIGERSVFCPPRVLLPEHDQPFCLFLDELPATSPEVQKAFYSLLLERRIGEHQLPRGSWVVAAGNRMQDRAMVRAMSSALVNRVVILNVRVDQKEWLRWANANGIIKEVIAFILSFPDALARPVPSAPVPFSTPRAWATLSCVLARAENEGILTPNLARALAFGTVSAEDAAVFSAMRVHHIDPAAIHPAIDYLVNPELFPSEPMQRWLAVGSVRNLVSSGEVRDVAPSSIETFLERVPLEVRFALLVGLVSRWGALGAEQALLRSLYETVGIE